ncbi:MAG: peptidoglycan bridge formation glycyltransferase FemA/FemB family protein [Candidatus Saccharibacteria bacterium]|nr:peptidoglycan bridge formation glycyltransferase FemA/FemB family protein [Candidatus Saccharibacteria bacterium]
MNIIDATDRKTWDNFITSHEESNFLQSWDFYEFHIARGKKVVRRLAVDDEGKILGAYAGVVETAKRGRYLAIAGGPILDWTNKKLVQAIFGDIKKAGQNEKCVFVRVRPQLELSDKSLKLMQSLGLKKAPMYLSVEYAGILDISKSEEEILAGASQGFRRKLRKAEKAGITVETSTDPKIVKTFYEIEVKHAKRQKFVAFSESFLTKQFTAFAENGEAIMYTAKLGKDILAQNFMIFYGDEASYHYGTSTDLGTKYSAAPLLHLKAMEEARNRGIKRYNLWGIVGTDETKHRFYGVSEFKRSFGCTELKYTPAHDLILNKPKYLLNKTVEDIRKHLRHV